MKVEVPSLKDVAYWSWGCGGHEIHTGVSGTYPVHKAPNQDHHAHAWIPHFVTTKNASLKHNPGPYVGWKQMYLGCHNRIAVFLREFKDDRIIITRADQTRMVECAIHMGYNWSTTILSEIVLHDKDMNPLRHITDIFYPMLSFETIELIFSDDPQQPLF